MQTHLSDELILGILSDTASYDEVTVAEQHMETCDTCSRRLETLAYLRDHFDEVWDSWTPVAHGLASKAIEKKGSPSQAKSGVADEENPVASATSKPGDLKPNPVRTADSLKTAAGVAVWTLDRGIMRLAETLKIWFEESGKIGVTGFEVFSLAAMLGGAKALSETHGPSPDGRRWEFPVGDGGKLSITALLSDPSSPKYDISCIVSGIGDRAVRVVLEKAGSGFPDFDDAIVADRERIIAAGPGIWIFRVIIGDAEHVIQIEFGDKPGK